MDADDLIRFLQAMDLLAEPTGITKKELARQLGRDKRSVDRIFNLFQSFGFPLNEVTPLLGKEKRWHLKPDPQASAGDKGRPAAGVPGLQFSKDEIISLNLLRSQANLLKKTGLEKYTDAAFLKLALYVTPEVRKRLDRIEAMFIPGGKFPKKYQGREGDITDLTDAILEQCLCQVGYSRGYDNKERIYTIAPLYLFERKGGLYVFVVKSDLGHDVDAGGEIRTLAVERLKWLRKTDRTFDYPPDFDPGRMLEAAFEITVEAPIKVKIWFSKDVARYVTERSWHPTQKIRKLKDGSLSLTMTASGRWDIKNWVLSYGPDARLLEPTDLRQEIVDELDTALAAYG